MSIDRLIARVLALRNPTVVGLDPTIELIPHQLFEHARGENPFERAANAVTSWGFALIDAIFDIVPAVKLQLACYEQFRYEGMEAYYKTIQYAQQRGMYVIADAKRGDIGSTCDCYAKAHLGYIELYGKTHPVFDADAMTVNPYLGSDGILPFMAHQKAVFVLVKTSNPSSGELQDVVVDGMPIYMRMAEKIKTLGSHTAGEFGFSQVGAVVGATYPTELQALRHYLPNTFFLIPGYGAQGGGASDVAAAFNEDGLGAIISASRSIIGAWKKHARGEDYAQCAREAALEMRDMLRTVAYFV